MAQFLFCSATIGDELVILSYFLVGFSVQMCTFDSARGSILGEKCEAGNTASKKTWSCKGDEFGYCHTTGYSQSSSRSRHDL